MSRRDKVLWALVLGFVSGFPWATLARSGATATWRSWFRIAVSFGSLTCLLMLMLVLVVVQRPRGAWEAARRHFGTGGLGLLFMSSIVNYLGSFALTYRVLDIREPGSFSEAISKVDAAYLAVATFTTTGFGDIHPVAGAARIIVTVQMLGGLLLVVFVLARAITLMSSPSPPPAVPHSTEVDAVSASVETNEIETRAEAASDQAAPVTLSTEARVAFVNAKLERLSTARATTSALAQQRFNFFIAVVAALIAGMTTLLSNDGRSPHQVAVAVVVATLFVTVYGVLIGLRVVASNVSATVYVRRIRAEEMILEHGHRPRSTWPPTHQRFATDLHVLCAFVVACAWAAAASTWDGLAAAERGGWTWTGWTRIWAATAAFSATLSGQLVLYWARYSAVEKGLLGPDEVTIDGP